MKAGRETSGLGTHDSHSTRTVGHGCPLEAEAETHHGCELPDGCPSRSPTGLFTSHERETPCLKTSK